MSIFENAVLVQQGGVTIRAFKVWYDDVKRTAKIEFDFVKREYKSTGDRLAVLLCCDAVIKYWPLYDIQNHTLIISGGHNHALKKFKKELSFL